MKKLILRLTHRIWNREISRLLCRAKQERIISNEQLHVIASWFDQTQKHKVY